MFPSWAACSFCGVRPGNRANSGEPKSTTSGCRPIWMARMVVPPLVTPLVMPDPNPFQQMLKWTLAQPRG